MSGAPATTASTTTTGRESASSSTKPSVSSSKGGVRSLCGPPFCCILGPEGCEPRNPRLRRSAPAADHLHSAGRLLNRLHRGPPAPGQRDREREAPQPGHRGGPASPLQPRPPVAAAVCDLAREPLPRQPRRVA